MSDIFISYARPDMETAEFVKDALTARGWQVWWDRKIPAGRTWSQVIGEALQRARCVVVLWSSRSIESDAVQEEAQTAKMYGKLVPAFIEPGVVPPFGFSRIQAADLSRLDASTASLQQFLDDVQRVAGAPSGPPPEEQKLPKEDAAPVVEPEDEVRVLERARMSVLDCVGPAYLLDPNYHFMDWNPSFDELIAKPLGLARGRHVSTFVRRLKNSDEVIRRSQETFASRTIPLVDVEMLEVETPRFGFVRYRKLATQLADETGRTLAWCVSLDIVEIDDTDRLWSALRARLETEINWSKYSASYDRLLLSFSHYNNLVDSVVHTVRKCERCLDIGAGTGNATFRMLEARPDRVVWAIESNESMLRHLRRKQRHRIRSGKDDGQRLSVLKADASSLVRVPREFFDAAIMVNVFYALSAEDKVRCIDEVHGVLKRGGMLVLTTSHSGTDVDRLLEELEGELRLRSDYRELLAGLDIARDSHRRMIDQIRSDTEEGLRKMLTDGGFDIQEMVSDYVDAVFRITAFKREKGLTPQPTPK